jgi:hypothetical protein
MAALFAADDRAGQEQRQDIRALDHPTLGLHTSIATAIGNMSDASTYKMYYVN